ncbi:MAG: FtsX-like permease family protein [Chitinophagaceae bacterium]
MVLYPSLNGRASANGREIFLRTAFTEPAFFRVFGFSLLTGDPASALLNPNSIVISQNTADKYFGNKNAIGNLIKLENGSTLIITGILANAPSKSHIRYDAFISYATVSQLEKDKLLPNKSADWTGLTNAYTYVKPGAGESVTQLHNRLQSIAAELNRNNKESEISFELQSLNAITPGTGYITNEIGNGGGWSKFYVEAGIALIILLSACFNYTNLSIARALTRAKEVGIRKVTGAKRSQVFLQYIIESVVISFTALLFAWLLMAFIIRYAPFNDGYEFIPSTFHYNPQIVLWSVGFAIFTGMIAGVSPAWIISSFKPVRVLKNLNTEKILGRINIRKALIVFQYSLSLVIIIFLMVFYKQFSFLGGADPGFKRANVLVVPLNGIDANIAAGKIQALNGVLSTGSMSATFTNRFNGSTGPVWVNNKDNAVSVNYYFSNGQFIGNMGLKLVAGENFASDAANGKELYVLINEKAVQALNLGDYNNALGKMIWFNDSLRLQVRGILKDFNYENMGSPVRPLAFRQNATAANYLYIQTAKVDKKAFGRQVEQALLKLSPVVKPELSWLDDDLEAAGSQSATISLLGYLAFMAVAIASLGLLGLVVYTVEVKRKEISIRKIVGATEQQIVRLLSKGFIRLLVIAGMIAIPIGYTMGYLFLNNFAARVSFGPGAAFACFVFLLIIGLVTIISQTYRAAVAKPAAHLRSE